MKPCIHCTQPIQDEALLCRHCKKRQDEPVMRSTPAGQKACVHCGQFILAEALICKHCKKQQSAPVQKEEKPAVSQPTPAVVASVAADPRTSTPHTAKSPTVMDERPQQDGPNPSAGPSKKLLAIGGGFLAALLVTVLVVVLVARRPPSIPADVLSTEPMADGSMPPTTTLRLNARYKSVNFWGNGATEYLLVSTDKSSLTLVSGDKTIEGQILNKQGNTFTATFPSVTSQLYVMSLRENNSVLEYHHPNGMKQIFTAE